MKLKICLPLLMAVVCSLATYAQPQRMKGYPQRESDLDVLPGFMNPPKGYGNVPFYWWNGDTLNRERMAEQLDILAASATDGFAVSYIHTDPHVDTLENKNGHGLFGQTEPGRPRVFSEQWWDTWNWFSGACARRGLGVGLDDYTVGWVGNGFYPDELDQMPVFKGYAGELVIQADTVPAGKRYTAQVPDQVMAVIAFPGQHVLTGLIKEGRIEWQAPAGQASVIYTITTRPGYVLHPEHGKRLVDVYFNRFESRMDAAGREGMNYFFQDELSYPINLLTWSDDFPEEFRKRKGYDLIPYLPALKANIGPITPKIRLDYCEVLMDLSEERYYKPIYDWHASRGLIYGCDNLSRGKDPIAYVDYFRAMSWFTAPGNDAPSRGSSFIETKVSSSITHLYNRPRTWLEAFHSMGWGSSGAWLTRQIDHHFIAGGNLVCMHGLYYSTHGGWWEWAPPDFHFRMPYWPHMKQWLRYTERMSYLLSQGTHVCDIALMYPTESMQAYPEATPNVAFDLAMRLSNSGLDYDFIDFRSLRDAETGGSTLAIGQEQYRVLVLADMKAMHHTSLRKILEFYRSGGIVLATGSLPKASNREGENDQEVLRIIHELFGLLPGDSSQLAGAVRQTNAAGGIGWYLADGSLESVIPTLITPDFQPERKTGKVLHRKAGSRDIYLVTDVEKGTPCFFRAQGKAELWDANAGTITTCPVLKQTPEGTWLRINQESTNSCLVVFSPGQPVMEQSTAETIVPVRQIPLEGEWEVELLPTLQNRWGDYRLPATDDWIAAEARTFRYAPATSEETGWTEPSFDDAAWQEGIYGYGPQLETRGADDADWMPVAFSWQYGVWDQPGAQGYHGLKGKVDDRFMILDRGGLQQFRTYAYAPHDGNYQLFHLGEKPASISIDGAVANEPLLTLRKGWHALRIDYAGTVKTPDYHSQTGAFHDDRKRSMVVIYPAGEALPENPGAYASQVASRWEARKPLLFDPYGGKYTHWNFRFTAAPGLEAMTVTVYGTNPRVWIDGKPLSKSDIRLMKSEAGWNRYQITLRTPQQRPSTVACTVEATPGYQGTALLKEPIRLKTGKGLLPCGDWSATGALLHYSGGMYYRTACTLSADEATRQVMLRLGEVLATCEVNVNGHPAGIRISPPYEVDITPYVQAGENRIEVLVYSTLSNHYQTIPTPYRGDPKAGLIGPVEVAVYE